MKWTSKAAEPKAAAEGLSPEAIRGRALALLTRREHSRAELSSKLAELGADAAQVEAILNELAERRLQDDGRFAEAFVRSRQQRGYGPVVIGQELRQRGVAQELASDALEAFDWPAEAIQVRLRRFGNALPADRREQARQLRFLQYRGFTSAQAIAATKATGDDWTPE